MILKTAKEGIIVLRSSIGLFNKAHLNYTSVNYLFIAKLAGDEMIQKIYKETAE